MKWRKVSSRKTDRDRSVEEGRVMGEFVGDEWLVIGAGLLDTDTAH